MDSNHRYNLNRSLEFYEDIIRNFDLIQNRLNEFDIKIDIPNYGNILSLENHLARAFLDMERNTCTVFLRHRNNGNWGITDYEDIYDIEIFFQIFCDAALVDGTKAELKEDLYIEENREQTVKLIPILKEIDNEIVSFIARNPKYLFEISPRKFEELIEYILKDFGFETQITPTTRDGGKDILAWIKNEITSLLTYVECKRYSPQKPVGVNVIREVYGVQKMFRANKSLIITTSRYTKDALDEATIISSEVDLKDYKDIVNWLNRYK